MEQWKWSGSHPIKIMVKKCYWWSKWIWWWVLKVKENLGIFFMIQSWLSFMWWVSLYRSHPVLGCYCYHVTVYAFVIARELSWFLCTGMTVIKLGLLVFYSASVSCQGKKAYTATNHHLLGFFGRSDELGKITVTFLIWGGCQVVLRTLNLFLE